MYSLYLIPFLTAFGVSVALLVTILTFFGGWTMLGREGARHLHKGHISRLGGVAIVISFLVALLLDKHLVFTSQVWALVIASVAILLFGVLDDFWPLSWKIQLLFQVSIVLLVFVLGIHIDYVTNPGGGIFLLNSQKLLLPAVLLVIFWVTLIMNSLNWIDGVDGLSGGVTALGMAVIFLLTLKPEVNQPPVGIIAIAALGSVLAFLIFNFQPAKIFAGTSGSMFMGFVLAVLAIFAGAKIATALLVTAIPVLDALWVIVQRLRKGKSIFEADNFHLHHRLHKLGWEPRRICGLVYCLTAIIGVAALSTKGMGKLIVLAMFTFLMASLFLVIQKKFTKLERENTKLYAKK